jgi:Rod binding domain-containing protein
MSDIASMLAINPVLSHNASIDAAMVKAKSNLSAKQLADIDKTAGDFESTFVSEMLKPMFDTVQTDPEFGGGEAEDTWKSLMIEQYGKKIVQAGGIGLADDIKAKMIEMQSAAQGGAIPSAMSAAKAYAPQPTASSKQQGRTPS